MMLRRDVAGKYLGDVEMDDEQDRGRLPGVVSHSTELHQLLVGGAEVKTCLRRTFSCWWVSR